MAQAAVECWGGWSSWAQCPASWGWWFGGSDTPQTYPLDCYTEVLAAQRFAAKWAQQLCYCAAQAPWSLEGCAWGAHLSGQNQGSTSLPLLQLLLDNSSFVHPRSTEKRLAESWEMCAKLVGRIGTSKLRAVVIKQIFCWKNFIPWTVLNSLKHSFLKFKNMKGEVMCLLGLIAKLWKSRVTDSS